MPLSSNRLVLLSSAADGSGTAKCWGANGRVLRIENSSDDGDLHRRLADSGVRSKVASLPPRCWLEPVRPGRGRSSVGKAPVRGVEVLCRRQPVQSFLSFHPSCCRWDDQCCSALALSSALSYCQERGECLGGDVDFAAAAAQHSTSERVVPSSFAQLVQRPHINKLRLPKVLSSQITHFRSVFSRNTHLRSPRSITLAIKPLSLQYRTIVHHQHEGRSVPPRRRRLRWRCLCLGLGMEQRDNRLDHRHY